MDEYDIKFIGWGWSKWIWVCFSTQVDFLGGLKSGAVDGEGGRGGGSDLSSFFSLSGLLW